MKTKNIFLISLAVMAAFFLSFQTASAVDMPSWYVEEMQNNQSVLEPGTTTYCKKNFSVTNMGEDMATVHVILGNGDSYWFEELPGMASKSYKLEPGTPFSTDASRGHRVEEARIVNTTAGHSKINITC